MSSAGHLGRAPLQTRAKATVAKLQAAARDILQEHGAAGLNTNLIAERAGVNIATLYRYYPDKYALLRHLFEEFEEGRRNYVLGRVSELADGADWRPWVRSVIEHLAEIRENDPSGVALRLAMASSPDLLEVDRESSDMIASQLAVAFAGIMPGIDPERTRSAARLVVEVITNGLDSAFSARPPNRYHISELENLVEAYLSLYLEA